MAKTKNDKGKGNRTNAFSVRYSDEEKGLVEAAAEARSLEVASWIRMVSVEAARREAKERGE